MAFALYSRFEVRKSDNLKKMGLSVPVRVRLYIMATRMYIHRVIYILQKLNIC